jgi:hypothetical protein
MSKAARAIAHFAARRVAPRLLRLLPSGLVAALLAEGLLLAWTQLRARPELGAKLWQRLRSARA